MNRYYIDYPRGFSNEYTVLVVTNDQDEADLIGFLPNALKITRKRALYFGRTAPNRARRFGRHWAGSFVAPGADVGDDPIACAVVDTALWLSERRREEAERAAAQAELDRWSRIYFRIESCDGDDCELVQDQHANWYKSYAEAEAGVAALRALGEDWAAADFNIIEAVPETEQQLRDAELYA